MDSNNELKIDKSSFICYKNTKITDEYTLSKTLGEGAFGTVRKAIHKATKQERAIKILKKREQDVKKLFLEVNILTKLTHPNIMDIYEFYEDKANFYIVSELCKGGELFDKITEKGVFTEAEACPIMLQILSAVCYSHTNNIVHRDIKPENIMLETKNSNPIIKLIDWGGARYYNKKKKMSTIRGTPYYIAPEVIGEEYDEKCDIWSCGVILYVLLCGYPPFNGDTDVEILKNVKTGKFTFPEEEWSVISESAKSLIKRMLTFEPAQRISAMEALTHPWFSNFEEKQKLNKKVAVSAFENMKKFKRNKKIEHATIAYITNQLISKEDREELLKLFLICDKNKDGVLSKEEIIESYTSVYGSIDEDQVDNMVKAVDIDCNGVIDYKEFLICTLNRDLIISKRNLELAFNAFDKDGNGRISIDEVMSIFKKTRNDFDKNIFEKMVRDADKDGDGCIEFEEFKSIMEKFFQ